MQRIITGLMAAALFFYAMIWAMREAWREQHRQPPPAAPPPAAADQLRALVAMWKLRGVRSPGALAAGFRQAQRAGHAEVARWIRDLTHGE